MSKGPPPYPPATLWEPLLFVLVSHVTIAMVFLVREAAASGIVCCWRGREYILLSPRFQSNCPSLTPAAIRHQQKRQSRGIGLCVCVFDPGAVQRPSETLICAVPQTKNTHYQSTGAHTHTHTYTKLNETSSSNILIEASPRSLCNKTALFPSWPNTRSLGPDVWLMSS